MEKQKGKIRTWYEDHKEEIKSCAMEMACYAFFATVGYKVSSVITGRKYGYGMYKLHEDGILKYYDPSNGQEIDVHKALEVAKELYRK